MPWIEEVRGGKDLERNAPDIAIEICDAGDRAAVDIASAQRPDELRRIGRGGEPAAGTDGRVIPVLLPELLERRGPLGELHPSFRPQSRRSRRAQRRQQDAGQQPNDRHHTEQFDECETLLW